MANRLVDAAAHAQAASEDSLPEPRELPSADELRARARRYRLLSETLVNPIVIEVVRACACELEAQASLIERAQKSSRE